MLELLHKALFALISGFSELIFASASTHQLLYRTVTGYALDDSFLFFGIHLGCLAALLMNCQQRIKYLRTQKRLDRPGKRRHVRQPDMAALIDIRILNTAVIPLLLGFLFYRKAENWINGPFRMAMVLVIYGALLFLPRLLRSGNKDSHSFTGMDGMLMGLGGALGVIPGFSRIGSMFSIGIANGAAKSYALDLCILLSIPAVTVMLCFDVYGCTVTLADITGLRVIGALVATVASYAGASIAIRMLRHIGDRLSTVVFSYYSWGMAMFMLLIYLFAS